MNTGGAVSLFAFVFRFALQAGTSWSPRIFDSDSQYARREQALLAAQALAEPP